MIVLHPGTFFFYYPLAKLRSNALQTPLNWDVDLLCGSVVDHPRIPRLVAKCSRSLDVRHPSFRRRKARASHFIFGM